MINDETINGRKYDLEDRTLKFTKEVIEYVKNLPKSIENQEICSQLVRAAGSVGANYIEANEALGRKDFIMRIRISRKEAKEARYWLTLSDAGHDKLSSNCRTRLIQEATELMKIFGSIVVKMEAKLLGH